MRWVEPSRDEQSSTSIDVLHNQRITSLTKGRLLTICVKKRVREEHDTFRISTVMQPQRMPKFMDSLLHGTVMEESSGRWLSKELRFQSAQRYYCEPSWTLGLSEDKIQIGHVQIYICYSKNTLSITIFHKIRNLGQDAT